MQILGFHPGDGDVALYEDQVRPAMGGAFRLVDDFEFGCGLEQRLQRRTVAVLLRVAGCKLAPQVLDVLAYGGRCRQWQ